MLFQTGFAAAQSAQGRHPHWGIASAYGNRIADRAGRVKRFSQLFLDTKKPRSVFPLSGSLARYILAVCHSVFPFVFAKCSACACQSGKLSVRFTEGSPGAFIGVSGDGGESVSGVVWPTE